MMPPMSPRANLVSQLMRVSVPDPSSLSQRPEVLERRTRFLIVRFLLSFNGWKIASVATGYPLADISPAGSLFGCGDAVELLAELVACALEQRVERTGVLGEVVHLGKTKLPIALELALAEELIDRRLVRKGVVRIAIGADVHRHVRQVRRFDIQQLALFSLRIVDLTTSKPVDRLRRIAARGDRDRRLEGDLHVEIDAYLENGIAKVGESRIGIGAGIHHHDASAASANHLVKAEIFEVSAIAQIDCAALNARQSHQLTSQRDQRIGRPCP